MRSTAAALFALATACSAPPPAPPPESSPPAMTTSDAPIVLPQGSGDYREVLTLARRCKAGAMTFDELQRALLARQLPPHSLGDGHLMIPVPAPPPGKTFNPEMMPKDWEGTWGEVAMAFWLGALSRDEYDRLHAAAHPQCPKR